MTLPATVDRGAGIDNGAGGMKEPTGLPEGNTLLRVTPESATSGRPRTIRAAHARTSIGKVRPKIEGRRQGARPRMVALSSEEQAVDRPSDDSPSEVRSGASAVPTPPDRHFLFGDGLRFGLGLRRLASPPLLDRAAAVGEFLLVLEFPCFFAHAMSSSVALSGCGNLQFVKLHFGALFTRWNR